MPAVGPAEAQEAPRVAKWPYGRRSLHSIVSAGSFVRDMGALGQALAKRDIFARNLVERDHQIIWRDTRRRDHATIDCLQQGQPLFFGTARDEGDFEEDKVV